MFGVFSWTACSDSSDSDGGSPADDGRAVRSLFDQQLANFRAGDFDALYENYSPAFREQCSQAALVASIEAAGIDPERLSFEDVEMTVQGDTARMTYTSVYDGEPMGSADASQPDIFTRIDGRWYDELDVHTHC
jgi:ketosteroid isomerase-like protein